MNQTEIFNFALTKLGANRVTSTTDGTREAQILTDLWPGVRQDFLAFYPWKRATFTTSLTERGDSPPDGDQWNKWFDLDDMGTGYPDFLAMYTVEGEVEHKGNEHWTIQQHPTEGVAVLLTRSASPVNIEYIGDLDTDARIDNLDGPAVKALALVLAMEAASNFAHTGADIQRLSADTTLQIKKARNASARQGRAKRTIVRAPILEARAYSSVLNDLGIHVVGGTS